MQTKRALLDKIGCQDDERPVLSRAWDLCRRCRERDLPGHTPFLTPREQMLCRQLLTAAGELSGAVFWGGYEEATRRQLHFLPGWAASPEENAIWALRASWYAGEALSHRELLGSLMGLGLARETIGDILVDKDGCSADILTADAAGAYLLTQWDRAGRVPLRLRRVALHDLHLPPQSFREIRDTVASLRLDSVVAAAFSLGRGKAAEAVASGAVQLNWQQTDKGDRPVSAGDVISVRGLGKCELTAVSGPTKKGRFGVTIKRYT